MSAAAVHGAPHLRYRSPVLQSGDSHARPADAIGSLKATVIVGIGSIVTVGLSVVTAKAYALLLGPAGVGLYGLMLSVLNLGLILASFGVGVSVIQATAAAVAANDWHLVRAVRRAASFLGLIGGAVGGLVLIVLRQPIANWGLGDATKGGDVVILAGALLLTVAAAAQVALLTGLHRVKAVTLVNVGSALTAAGAGIALVAAAGTAALAPALVVTAAVQLALSSVVNRRPDKAGSPSIEEAATVSAGEQLLRTGAPVAASQLVSTGVQLAIPVLVLQLLGTDEVGYYRAAATISVGYLTFFLASLTQDYLPRISGAADSSAMILLIERRMRLVMSLGLPLILGLLALGPFVIELLYSSAFAPALDVLQWQLIGDMVRLPAWVLAFVLLGGRGGRAYFGAELSGGTALAAGTVLGLAILGLAGAGVGYAVSQVVYYGVLWMLVRRRLPLRPGRLQMGLLIATACCAAVLLFGVGTVQRLIVFGTATVALSAYAWPRTYLLHRRGEL